MSIYTKIGDKGETAIFGGKRVPKYDPQIEANGAVDEVNAFIGWSLESIDDGHVKSFLTDIQQSLYKIMGYLAGASIKEGEIQNHTQILEKEIDTMEKNLPKLTRFILPQGSEASARLHIARTQVRSAERRVVKFIDSKKERDSADSIIIMYLNRLSDFFFMLARKFSKEEKVT